MARYLQVGPDSGKFGNHSAKEQRPEWPIIILIIPCVYLLRASQRPYSNRAFVSEGGPCTYTVV